MKKIIEEDHALLVRQLIALRKERNLTQKQVAALVGVARTQITALELANSHVSGDMLMRLCKAYQVRLDFVADEKAVTETFEKTAKVGWMAGLVWKDPRVPEKPRIRITRHAKKDSPNA